MSHKIKARILKINSDTVYIPKALIDSSLVNADYALLQVYRNDAVMLVRHIICD